MLFRKHIVSTRTLSQLAVALVLSVAGAGTATAANTGNPPLLVPYTQVTAAGDAQWHGSTASSPTNGYTGDQGPAISYVYCSAAITTNCVYTSDPTKNNGTLTNPVTVTGAELNNPHMVAVDSVGNIYITDTNNAVIREVNAQTGIINTIAGAVPVGGKAQTGCADGAPAYGSRIGAGLSGIAVDGYGNVYFTDSTQHMAAVIYRGGARVAAFIQFVNPGAVAVAGGVLPGYIYHIAGTISVGNPTNTGASCAATALYSGAVSDNAPAFENTAAPPAIQGATLNKPGLISLDSAGNIYISDVGDATVRVINTQFTVVNGAPVIVNGVPAGTPQTFYQYTVLPGYMRSITNCNGLLTILCPAISTSTQGTGYNAPVNEAPSTSQWIGSFTDAYGNTFQIVGSGGGISAPGYFGGVAYAGGAPVTNLLMATAPSLASYYGPNGLVTGANAAPPELPLVYGDWYLILDNPAASGGSLPGEIPVVYAINNISLLIRSTDLSEDTFGTLLWNDNHYPELFRIDQYSSTATALTGGAFAQNKHRGTTSVTGVYTQYASFTYPWFCVYGSSGAANNFGAVSPSNPNYFLYQYTYDPEGDGCPSLLGMTNSLKYGQVADGMGNVFVVDNGYNLVKELRVDNDFPATPLASSAVANPVTQGIQVHFDAGNPPAGISASTIPDGAAVGHTTTAFSITPTTDFTINTTMPNWPMGSLTNGDDTVWGSTPISNSGNFQLWPPVSNPTNIVGLPSCTQLGISLVPADTGYDCLVYVTFNPVAVGLRQAQLVAHTANGGTYTFSLTGLGEGGQLAIDGGQGNALTVNSSVALGPVPQVAVTSAGVVYIADPANNRIVVQPTSAFGVTTGLNATTVGSGLSGPMGVAVDAAGNVYISDTGNNRVVKVTPGGAQSAIGNNVWIAGATCYPATGSPAGDCTLPTNVPSVAALGPDPTPGAVTGTTAPPQYQFKAPQGLAVDTKGNVYVADTGNAAVVEIPANINLGGAIPLLAGTGVAAFVNPVGVAVDSQNNIYVADTGNPAGEVVRIPPGGGDLQPGNVVGLGALTRLPLFGGQGITTPNGVAADAAGNVYISDSSTNLVWVAPAAGQPNGAPYTLNLGGLNSPGGIALDPSGNLYVADTLNHQIIGVNRINPTVTFGIVPQNLTSTGSGIAGTPVGCPVAGSNQSCTGVLTVTNIGNQPLTLAPTSTFQTISGTGFASFTATQNCTTGPYSNLVLPAGDSCTITPNFLPTSSSSAQATLTVNGTQSVALLANGGNPEAVVTLTSSVGLTPAAGSTPVITATVTNSHVAGTPAGTVTFTYAIDAGTANAGNCGASGTSAAIPLNGSGVATYTLPAMAQGLVYTVNAVYTPAVNDPDGLTIATPIVLTVPGISLTSVKANSVTFTYGQPVPAITGSITPALPTGVTATFTPGGASQFSPVGVYAIGVTFSGTNACSYGFPAITTPSGGVATVTENKASLTVTVPDYTTVYGAASFNFASRMTITGAVGSDLSKLSATFTNTNGPPPTNTPSMDSSVLNVGVYQVYPTVTGKPVGNYNITITPSPLKSWTGGSDTVTPAPAGIAVTAAAGVCNANFSSTAPSLPPTTTCELPANVNKGSFALSVGTLVTAGKGIPSGTVSVTDNFIPITPTFFDTSTSLQPLPPASGMPACSSTVTSNCYAAICTAAMTNCYTYSPPCTAALTAAGTACNLPCSATVTANCFAQPCSSSVTSYCYNTYPPCSATVTSNCNVPVNLSAGSGTFALPATENAPAVHYLTFTYSGDLPLCTNTSGTNCIPPVCSTTQTTNCVPPPCTGSAVPPACIVGGPAAIASDAFGDFVCSVAGGGATASCPTTQSAAFPMVVDFADFNITSTFVLIDVQPGVVPSGNGLPVAPGQSTSALETGTLQLQAVLGFNGGGSNTGAGIGPINVTCASNHPSYISCFMTPTTTCLTSTSGNCLPAQSGVVTTSTVTLAVSTPVSEPLGFNTSQVRTAATRTALAFLPFGVLAFCVRRRRRLSQVLWMLIAICAVSAGMIGCSGSNQSDLYTPIPTGTQSVVVTISGTTPIAFTGTVASGSASVTSISSTLGLAAGQTIAGTGIPTGATIASISGTTLTLSANATAGATETLNATLAESRSYTIPIYIF